MNGITILIWITIAIVGVISCILVKLHYKGDELEHDEKSIIPSADSLNEVISQRKEKFNTKSLADSLSSKSSRSNNSQSTRSLYGNQKELPKEYTGYIAPEINNKTFEYESENQLIIDYGNQVKKFQEPIKQSQMDIMNQNKEDKTELKDLFTIDELIKESKRKDDERQKEQPKADDPELDELKESIVKKQSEEFDTIGSLINKEAEDEKPQETPDAPELAQKEENITDVLLSSNNDDLDIPNKEIKEPTLKTPSKIQEEPAESETTRDAENLMDLDYRKDLDKFTKKIKGSKIFQDVKEKLSAEPEDSLAGDIYTDDEIPQEETYIRTVKEYDEFEPIINETHVDYVDPVGDIEPAFTSDDQLEVRQEPKSFEVIRDVPKPEAPKANNNAIKSKPARDNLKITINNNEVVLKKGDEIIFNYQGESYSSQVYAIRGDEISVRYRRQNITIKPSDVKKIY